MSVTMGHAVRETGDFWPLSADSAAFGGLIMFLIAAVVVVFLVTSDRRSSPGRAERSLPPARASLGDYADYECTIPNPPVSRQRLRIVPATRTRFVSDGGISRLCRFCGLPLGDGDHAPCERGVLDG